VNFASKSRVGNFNAGGWDENFAGEGAGSDFCFFFSPAKACAGKIPPKKRLSNKISKFPLVENAGGDIFTGAHFSPPRSRPCRGGKILLVET